MGPPSIRGLFLAKMHRGDLSETTVSVRPGDDLILQEVESFGLAMDTVLGGSSHLVK